MIDTVFHSLLIHVCTIESATPTAGGDDTYGQETTGWDDPTVYSDIPCRLMPMSIDEMARMGLSASVSGSYSLHISRINLPEGLSMTGGLSTHRVVNVKRLDGTVYDTGPFDIDSVVDAAGMGHHVKLLLQRVTPA